MSLPTTEEEWLKIIGNPRLTRSIFAPVHTCTLFITYGSTVSAILKYEIPYQDFHLEAFDYGASLGDPLYKMWLQLNSTAKGDQVSRFFRMKWFSFYRKSKDPSIFRYVYRPEAIRILIPDDPKEYVSVSPTSKTPYPKASKTVGLPVRPLKVLKSLSQNISSTYDGRSLTKAAKNGFSGSAYQKPVYPVTETHSAYNVYYSFDGSPPTVTDPTYQVEDFYKNVSSSNTPNFGKLKRGKLPVNPYSLVIRKTQDRPGFMALHFNAGVNRQYYGHSYVTFFPFRADPSFNLELQSKTIKKLEKLADADISANVAQDLAQFGQLVNLVTSTTGRITKAIGLVKKGNIAGALQALGQPGGKKSTVSKSTAKNWLEIQYAWKILLKEIDDLMKMIANIVQNNPPPRTIRASSRKQTESTEKYGYSSGFPLATTEIKTNFACKVGITYSVSNQLLAYAQQLGFTNPINLGYEVLPYSFVVDWFLPIGPYLESLSAWQGMVFKQGYLTNYVREDLNSYTFGKELGVDGNYREGEASMTRSTVVISREKLTTFPRQNLPRPKSPVSLTHALNGIALMRIAFK